MKPFLRCCAYLLLILLPLQSIAAANMLICNSMMQLEQSQAPEQATMPCHDMDNDNSHHEQKSYKSCGLVCNSLCAMTALPNTEPITTNLVTATLIGFSELQYVSITLPQLQRPPILLT